MSNFCTSIKAILPHLPTSFRQVPLFFFECATFLLNVASLPLFILTDRPFRKLCYTNRTRSVKQIAADGSYTYWAMQDEIRLPECEAEWARIQTLWQQTRHMGQLLPALAKQNASKSLLGIREPLPIDGEASVETNNNKVSATVRLANTYTWATVGQVNREVQQLAVQLHRRFNISSGQRVAILMDTCPQWYVSVHALYALNATPVTLYASLGHDALVHALGQSRPVLIITDSSLADSTLEKVRQTLPEVVKRIMCVQPLQVKPVASDTDSASLQREMNTRFEEMYTYFVDLFAPLLHTETVSAKQELDLPNYSDASLALLIYTSGSTGLSKAVMITHRQMNASMRAVSSRLLGCYSLHSDSTQETYLAYLPLAHIFEFLCQLAFTSYGGRLAFARAATMFPNPRLLHRESYGDLYVAAPTVMTAVPLVLERVRSTLRSQIAKQGAWKLDLFESIARQRDGWRSLGFDCQLSRVMFGSIKKEFGGRLRMWISGGAPLSESTQRFVQSFLDIQVCQAYASTECTGDALIQDAADATISRAGAPLAGVRLRLDDWAEGNNALSSD